MADYKSKGRLIEGSEARHLVVMGVPMTFGLFAIIAFNLADTYFVAQLGTQPMAAMAFTFPVVMTLIHLALGLGTGASSIIARAIGEGDQSKVKRYATDSLLLSFLVVVVFVLIGHLTMNPLFRALGADEATLPLVREYMEIWYLGMVCIVVPMVGNSIIRATGDTFFPAMIMTFAAVINIVLDPLLIFGLWGFPRLELEGAAIATVVARALTLFAALGVMHFREGLLSFRRPRFSEVLDSWKKILHVGVPAALNNMIVPVSIGIVTSLIAHFGPGAVAAFGIATRTESFVLIPIIAITASIGPFVGQNWGAKKYDRIRKGLNLSFFFCVIWGLLIAAVLGYFSDSIAALFSENSSVIEMASFYLCIVPISYGAMGMVMVICRVFNALGNPLPATLITVLHMLVLYVPLALIGRKLFGIYGIFYAACFSNFVLSIVAYVWNRKKYKTFI